MKVWFLVYVLTTGHGTELQVALQMPDEEHCRWLEQQYVHAREYYVGPPEPGQTDVSYEREIEEVQCVPAEDDS